MNRLNLPSYCHKIEKREDKLVIFDSTRRKFVALTPEEWVRQHFVNYLCKELDYPAGLIANEVQLKVANTTKRCDTLVYNRLLQALVLIEYKAPDQKLTQEVLDQILRYNYTLRVPYLILSNGLQHLVCRVDYQTQTYQYLEAIPRFASLEGLEGLDYK